MRAVVRILGIGLAPVLLSTGLAASAEAAPAQAVPKWSMVPQVKDANRDGVIDGDGGFPRRGALSTNPSTVYVGAGNFRAQPNERLINGVLSWYLEPGGYPVRLDACASTGDRFSWTVRAADGTVAATVNERPLGKKSCTSTVLLPEGAYSLELAVTSGKRVSRARIPAQVQNILFVAFGDSYASGEGTPRNVAAWLKQGAPFRPYWDDDSCHRSVLAGPAQAALALEQSSAMTSVTFVFAACAGATVDGGLLGTQPGQVANQLDLVRNVIGNRPIDIATVSIGGNDVGFTDILTTCLTVSDCPVARAPTGVLAGYPTLQQGVQARLGRLAGQLPKVAACLSATPTSPCTLVDGRSVPPLPMSPGGRVIPMLYPDITRATSGQPCTYLTMGANEFAWARSALLVPGPGPDAQFRTSAGATLALPLTNGTLNSVLAGTASLGWAPAVGTWGASGDSSTGHGVCAGNEAWAYGLTALSGFTSASFHPNPAGQQVTGRQLFAAISG